MNRYLKVALHQDYQSEMSFVELHKLWADTFDSSFRLVKTDYDFNSGNIFYTLESSKLKLTDITPVVMVYRMSGYGSLGEEAGYFEVEPHLKHLEDKYILKLDFETSNYIPSGAMALQEEEKRIKWNVIEEREHDDSDGLALQADRIGLLWNIETKAFDDMYATKIVIPHGFQFDYKALTSGKIVPASLNLNDNLTPYGRTLLERQDKFIEKSGGTVVTPEAKAAVCECGKDKHNFFKHANFCPKFEE